MLRKGIFIFLLFIGVCSRAESLSYTLSKERQTSYTGHDVKSVKGELANEKSCSYTVMVPAGYVAMVRLTKISQEEENSQGGVLRAYLNETSVSNIFGQPLKLTSTGCITLVARTGDPDLLYYDRIQTGTIGIGSPVYTSVPVYAKNYYFRVKYNITVSYMPSSGFEWTKANGGATIIKYHEDIGNKKSLVIPAEIEGYPVVSISDYAFQDCSTVEHITIPYGVKSLGSSAFYNCRSLMSVSIPSSVMALGENVFLGCHSLQSVILPKGVKHIRSASFKGCYSLKDISIPNTVQYIERGAFGYCESLEHITIPDSVMSIGSSAFEGCCNLVDIKGSLDSVALGDSVFAGCVRFADARGFIIVQNRLYGYSGAEEDIIIPYGVKSVEYLAFSSSSIKSVVIPDTVVSIKGMAFWGCGSLKSVKIGSGVSEIGESAFSRCSLLTSVNISSQTISIGDSAFKECSSLSNITILGSVKEIGYWAFRMCTSLADANGLVIIGNKLVYYCGSQANVVIPEGVVEICDGAFLSVSSLKSVTVPNSVKTIGWRAFYGCSSLNAVSMPNTVREIGDEAFKGCRALADVNGFVIIKNTLHDYLGSEKVVAIPSEVRSIGSSAFDNCDFLDEVVIPNGVANIGKSAFYECDSLVNIDIPDSVTYIGDKAFSHCRSLKNVRLPKGITRIEEEVFFCCTKLNTLVIPDGVTSIERRAFYGCEGLGSIQMPDGLVSVGENAFYNARQLTELKLPGTVVDVGFNAFKNCDSLLYAKMPNGLKNLVEYNMVFYNYPESCDIEFFSGTYTVRFRKYDGSGATRDQIFTVGKAQSLLWKDSQLGWSRPGYEFVGWVPWNPDTKPRLCKYVNGQTVKDIAKAGEVVNLYAAWKSLSSYRVCFHRNAGTGDSVQMNQVILRNKSDSLAWMDSQIGWSRPGYTFVGWAESAGSAQVKYTNGAGVLNLAMDGGTKHLYAVWRASENITYTVRFYKYDGSGATRDQIFRVGTAQRLLWKDSQLGWSRPGYEFIGWVPWNPDTKPRLCKYLNGQEVLDLATTQGAVVHLWAAWKSKSSYRVCFHRNYGSGDSVVMDQVILRNKEDNLAWMDSQIGWTRPGYSFKGWAESAGSSRVNYMNGAGVLNLAMDGGTKHLYAVWESESGNVATAKLSYDEFVPCLEVDSAAVSYGMLLRSTGVATSETISFAAGMYVGVVSGTEDVFVLQLSEERDPREAILTVNSECGATYTEICEVFERDGSLCLLTEGGDVWMFDGIGVLFQCF